MYYYDYVKRTHHIQFIIYFHQFGKDVDYKDLIWRDGLYYEKFSNEPFAEHLLE